MTDGGDLYERAAGNDAGLGPLWHVEAGRTFFAGPLRHNGMHQHGAPVYLAGIHGPFHLRVHGGEWLTCRTAVIPAGVLHELDVHGEPIAVFYIEPSLDGIDALTPLMRDAREVNGALAGNAGELSLLRELWEDKSGVEWAGRALDDLLDFSRRRAARRMDPRISTILNAMHGRHGELTPVAQLAATVGLSASRFQHLFTREAGVAFRRYRAWTRMRMAIGEIARGSNFTTAAHAAGFSDQAHFNHDFRRTFGAPPSVSLLNLRT